jgi:hypothetical protein
MMGQSLATSNPLGIGQMIQNYLPAESTAESGSKLNAQL